VGDTVWRACQSLNDVFAGQVLTRCEFRVPVLATTDLTLRASEVAAQLISLANLRCGCSVSRQPFLEIGQPMSPVALGMLGRVRHAAGSTAT
jgi:hypothetical protein